MYRFVTRYQFVKLACSVVTGTHVMTSVYNKQVFQMVCNGGLHPCYIDHRKFNRLFLFAESLSIADSNLVFNCSLLFFVVKHWKQIHLTIIMEEKGLDVTLYTLTSVCIFSKLFSLHFLWNLQGEFVYNQEFPKLSLPPFPLFVL